MMVWMRVDFHAAFCVQQWETFISNGAAHSKDAAVGFGDLYEGLESVHLLLKATRKYRLLIHTKLDLSVKLTTM